MQLYDECNVLYQQALEDATFERKSVDKELLYVQDTNSGSYSGVINFDTAQLSNSGRWLAWKEGYITIPYTVAFASSANQTVKKLGYIAMLKNGGWNIIDSVQIEYNNTTVVQSQPLTNMLINFRSLTRWSADDLVKYGDVCWFAGPDSPAFRYIGNAASVFGDGLCNNMFYSDRRAEVVANAAAHQTELSGAVRPAAYNEALYALGSSIVNKNVAVYGDCFADGIVTVGNLQNVFAPTFRADAGVDEARVYQTDMIVTIRLCDLHDFFSQLPLVKGGFMRISVYYNAARATITTANQALVAAVVADAFPGRQRQQTLVHTTHTQLYGSSTPFIVGAGCDYNPCISLDAGVLTLEANVVRTSTPASQPLPVQSCRLYVPGYTLDVDAEQSLLSANPVKEIAFEELYSYTIRSVAAGASFSYLVTNGLIDPMYIVLVPFTSSSNNLMAASMANKAEYQSCFSSCPSTTTFAPIVSGFNVKLSGSNVFRNAKGYGWEEYLDELSKTGLNAGSERNLVSGLLSFKHWSFSHRYYYANLSRRNEDEDVIPKSIEVVGTNQTPRTMDYIALVVYRRRLKINMVDGTLSE